ncbi:histidine kinase [Streptomyces sp. GC420]|uniref:sensor histidine kinase n=1 Tax=Streptomyces sp. GC420 TaxID=2697568 RepID=UPI0028BF4232|nr:histidine kinase [Streptomyces sp. GC420]
MTNGGTRPGQVVRDRWRLRARLTLWAGLSLSAGALGAWAYARTGASTADVVRDLAVGWSFAGAGLVAWWRRPANRTGPLMLAEGLTWFLGNLQGTSVPLLFAVGAWWEALNMAVLAHLLLAFPDGRLGTRFARSVVTAGYGLTAVGGLLRAAVYDPAASGGSTYLTCADCGPNALLVVHDPALFDAVDLGYRWLGALITLACVVALVRRWRVSCPARRRVLLPAWAAVAVAVAFIGWEAAYALAPEFPGRPGAGTVLLLSDLSQVSVPIAFAAGLLRMRLHRAAVGGLVVEVGAHPTPHLLQSAIARVMGDPSLRLGLGAGAPGTYVDPDGRPLPLPAPDSGRTATAVESRGKPVAVLVHDTALREDPGLVTAVAATVRLCLENTRLGAEIARRTEEARARHSRLLETAERERRRLERDLHDGAQARLVFALMALRRLDAGLSRGADPVLRGTVAEADRLLRQALSDLRDIAHGIHPAVLEREGLGPAVTSLAEQSAIPVVVAVEPRRLPPLIESTAYFTVCEALSNASKHAGARAVSVMARVTGGRLVVEVTDDGSGGADRAGSGLRGLTDRVAAVGGTLHVESAAGSGTRIRAELPCA